MATRIHGFGPNGELSPGAAAALAAVAVDEEAVEQAVDDYLTANPPSGGTSDHGALDGLSDDDHTQYHTDARGDVRYYTKSQTDALLSGATPVASGSVSTAPAKALLLSGLAYAPESGCGIVFIGSSTTGSSYPNKLIAALQRRWPNGDTESTVTTFPDGSTPTWSAGVHGYKLNVSGGTTNTYATEAIIDKIATIKPRAVIHGVGSNDYSGNMAPATYKANLLAAIADIDEAMVDWPTLHILTHHQERSGTYTYPWSDYLEVLQEVAALDPSSRIAVDASGYFTFLKWREEDWFGLNSGDNIHLSEAGTAMLAEIMYGVITEMFVAEQFPAIEPPTGPVPDTTAPTPGTLTDSAITGAGFTLTVTGASDERDLHATPYRFSTDAGSTYSDWQVDAVYNAGGLDPSTEYTCQHQVRDESGNVATGTPISVTTNSDADIANPEWSATLTPGTPTYDTVVIAASALATDNIAVTGYEVALDGTTWVATTAPVGTDFTLTGLDAATTYADVEMRAKDAAGNSSTPLSVPSFTTAAAWSPASISGLNLWLKGEDLVGAEGASIATWTDSSGLGNHAIAGSPAPTVTELGGHRAANFAGTYDHFTTPVSASDAARTMFIVFRTPNNTATATMMGNSGSVAQGGANLEMASSRRLQVRASGGSSGLIASANLPENTWVVASGRVSQPENVSTAWVGASATTTGTAPNAPAAGMVVHIGTKQTVTEQFDGELAEVLNYGVKLSDSDRLAVHEYLRAKYGTS